MENRKPMAGSRSKPRSEYFVHAFLWLSAALSVFTTLGMTWILVQESFAFFRHVSIVEFLTGKEWYPLFEPAKFGVLPLVCGTLLVAVGSALIAIPVGSMTALYLSEYASARKRALVKPTLELLSGIPTVVYGYFALTFITPLLQRVFPQTQVFNALSAAIVVAIMVLPMIASLSDDALSAVPKALRYAAYGLGATKFDVSTKVVFPSALSGIVASYVLAISRAIGETMAVTLAAGSTPKLTLNPLESIQTMTAYIVQVSLGDTPSGTVQYQTIFAVGLALFVMTLSMNLIAQRILKRYRLKYE